MRRAAVFLFALVANLVLADAACKELAAGYLKGVRPVSVIKGFFDLAYVENRGCAWGLMQGHVWPLAVIGLVAIALLLWKHRAVFGTGRVALLTEALLYAGIVGNLLDRVFRGYVIDFLDFHWQAAYHFPCFNLADMFITCAAALLIFRSQKCR